MLICSSVLPASLGGIKRAADDLRGLGQRAATILYDEENGAPFFQFYSRQTAGGLFIEIVQRDAAYSGFGAPNAPFRIAAQKRAGLAKGMPAT